GAAGACARPAGTSAATTATAPNRSAAHFLSRARFLAPFLHMGSLDQTRAVRADVHQESSGLAAQHRTGPEIRRHFSGPESDGHAARLFSPVEQAEHPAVR